jgi:hypothetical protein
MEEKWNVYKLLRKEPFAKPPSGKSRRMKDTVKMKLGDISCVLGTGSAYYSSISFIKFLGFVSRALAGVFSLQTRSGQTVFLSYVIVSTSSSGKWLQVFRI